MSCPSLDQKLFSEWSRVVLDNFMLSPVPLLRVLLWDTALKPDLSPSFNRWLTPLNSEMLYGIKENCRFGANPWMFSAFINFGHIWILFNPSLTFEKFAPKPFFSILSQLCWFAESIYPNNDSGVVNDLTDCLVKIFPLWKCSIVGKQIFCLFGNLSWLDLALFCKKKIVCKQIIRFLM